MIAVEVAVVHTLFADRVLALLSVVSLVSDGIRSKTDDASSISGPSLAVANLLKERVYGDGFTG
jgi:hypothetical protein